MMNSWSERKNTRLFTGRDNVNPHNTFEHFIEGKCNRMARSCALEIAEEPGKPLYNPFIVYSPVGFGKTHLIQAIFNKIITERPGTKVYYLNSLTFVQQFTQSVINKRKEDFFNFYCNSDVLIIDDLQCFSGKEKTQQALLSLFDRLYQDNRQFVTATGINRFIHGIN